MTDHVYKKFSDGVEKIRALMQNDAAFAEMCADYEEISTWLACYRDPKGLSPEEFDRAQELIQDLEDEIRQALGGNTGR